MLGLKHFQYPINNRIIVAASPRPDPQVFNCQGIINPETDVRERPGYILQDATTGNRYKCEFLGIINDELTDNLPTILTQMSLNCSPEDFCKKYIDYWQSLNVEVTSNVSFFIFKIINKVDQ